ncbi:LicD family-domain-containing protein, partial [Sordaria brevicollis]
MSSSLTPERRAATSTTSRKGSRHLLTLLMTLSLILSSLANPLPLPIEGHSNLLKPPVKQQIANPSAVPQDPKTQGKAQFKQFAASPPQPQPDHQPTTTTPTTSTTPSLPSSTNPLLPEHKYFHEPGYTEVLSHYDSRFFSGEPIPYAPHIIHLRHLIRSYLLMTSELNLKTWLAHGTLLGWYWNGGVMPWDYDLDVQVSNKTLGEMGGNWNGTVWEYVFRVTPEDEGKEEEKRGKKDEAGELRTKKYMLDVNPYWSQRTRLDGLNIIDARWIDMENGMYVDITGLSEDRLETAKQTGSGRGKGIGVWTDKNYHGYATRQIWPLRRTEFEGVEAWVPFDVDGILTEEYGGKSLTVEEFAGHYFDHGRKKWVKTELA